MVAILAILHAGQVPSLKTPPLRCRWEAILLSLSRHSLVAYYQAEDKTAEAPRLRHYVASCRPIWPIRHYRVLLKPCVHLPAFHVLASIGEPPHRPPQKPMGKAMSSQLRRTAPARFRHCPRLMASACMSHRHR